MSAYVLGVDTNVLVRFLTADDERQSAEARALLADPAHHPVYLSMLVLAEAFTVMTKVKKFPADEVVEAYRQLLRSPQVEVERSDLVSQALDDAIRTHAGFPDALIGLQNAAAGCATTATFDVRAARLATMSAVAVHL